MRMCSHNSHMTLIESGSVLGPVLFSTYTLLLGAILGGHQPQYFEQITPEYTWNGVERGMEKILMQSVATNISSNNNILFLI